MFNYLTAKTIGTVLFIFTIAAIWLTILIVFTDISINKNIMSIFIFLLISILFNVSLSMFITSFIDKEEELVLISNIFIFINAIIGGSIIPIQMMPDALQRISIISPNYWMIRGFLYFQTGFNIKEGLLIGVSMIIISIVFLIFTGKGFRYE